MVSARTEVQSAVGTQRKKGKEGSLLIGGDRKAGSQGMSRASETEVSIMEIVKCTSKKKKVSGCLEKVQEQ